MRKNSKYKYLKDAFKAGVGSIFLVSLGKYSIITFQHTVTQVVYKNIRLLRLSLVLYSDVIKLRPQRALFSQPQVFSQSMCFYWLRYAVLLSDRWCHYELMGWWNKWCAVHSKTGLWTWQAEVQMTPSAGLNRPETD